MGRDIHDTFSDDTDVDLQRLLLLECVGPQAMMAAWNIFSLVITRGRTLREVAAWATVDQRLSGEINHLTQRLVTLRSHGVERERLYRLLDQDTSLTTELQSV